MTIEAHFRDKIERRVAFYEHRVSMIDTRYTRQVEKLAAGKKDQLVADYFRETADPKHIMARLRDIRNLCRDGDIVEADNELERLQNRLELLEQHLRHPIFKAGLGTSRGGQKSAAKKWGPDRSSTHEQILRMFDEERAKGLSIGRAEHNVARTHWVSTRTVRAVRTGK